jgi:hypothetical protein
MTGACSGLGSQRQAFWVVWALFHGQSLVATKISGNLSAISQFAFLELVQPTTHSYCQKPLSTLVR